MLARFFSLPFCYITFCILENIKETCRESNWQNFLAIYKSDMILMSRTPQRVTRLTGLYSFSCTLSLAISKQIRNISIHTGDVNELRRLSTAITLVCTLNYRSSRGGAHTYAACTAPLPSATSFAAAALQLQFRSANRNFLWHTILVMPCKVRLGRLSFSSAFRIYCSSTGELTKIEGNTSRCCEREAAFVVERILAIRGNGWRTSGIIHRQLYSSIRHVTPRAFEANSRDLKYVEIPSLKRRRSHNAPFSRPTSGTLQIASVFIVKTGMRDRNSNIYCPNFNIFRNFTQEWTVTSEIQVRAARSILGVWLRVGPSASIARRACPGGAIGMRELDCGVRGTTQSVPHISRAVAYQLDAALWYRSFRVCFESREPCARVRDSDWKIEICTWDCADRSCARAQVA